MIKMTTFFIDEVWAYTKNMSFFVQPTLPSTPKTDTVRQVSLFLAVIIILMAVTQLFSFEDFPDVLTTLSLPGGDLFSKVWAAGIVTLEVAAIPFLFSMVLSPVARVISMLSGWVVSMGWILISLWIMTIKGLANVGILGATVSVPSGWWMVFFCIGLAVLMAWSSWGMWPVGVGRKK